MKRAAFTLVESLVVMAVIAMLIAMLVPVLSASREQARAVTCALNLKHLSLALTAYNQEKATFPFGFDCSQVGLVTSPPEYPGDGGFYDWLGLWWFQFLAPTLGEDFSKGTVFWCPSRSVQDPGPEANVLCGNYGANRAICKDAVSMGSEFVGTPLSACQIRPPDATLLIADSGYSLISWRGATDALIGRYENLDRESCFYVPGLQSNRDRIILPGFEDDAINGRHPNQTVNVGFVDAHVRRVKADDLFVKEIGSSYLNLSPLWLPKQNSPD